MPGSADVGPGGAWISPHTHPHIEDALFTQAAHDALANPHHAAFTAGGHAALPNPHHSNANDHANTLDHSNALDHANTNDPTSGQKAALAGSSGTPGDTNRYVTDGDARNTDARTPTAHAHPESDVTGLVSDLAGKSATGHTHSYEPAGAVVTHEAAADPHTGYQRESERNAASGYAGLDSGTKLTGTQIPYGSTANTAAEGNDGRLSDARTPLAHSHPQSDVISLVSDLAGKAASTHGITAAHDGFPGGASTFLREDGTWVTPAAGALTLTTVEVSLGSAPDARRSGAFTITGSGLTAGKPVSIQQASGPYTGKGTRTDEAEKDQVLVTGKVLNATTIQCYWNSRYRVRGNFKMDYVIGA